MKRIIKGLAALAGLILIMVGLPIMGWIAGGSPIPTNAPVWGDITDALTQPDDGTLFLTLLKYIGWIAWISFAVIVLLEVASRIRGARTPRLPGLVFQQRAAAGLIGAIVILFTAAPLIGGGSAAVATPGEAGSSATHVGTDAGRGLEREAVQPPATPTLAQDIDKAPDAAASGARPYEVKSGDSLYAIAERVLHDGNRWKEIAALNYGVQQADGQALTDAHWIQPGWTLQIPVVDQVTVQPGQVLSDIARDQLGDADRWPELFEASKDIIQPGGVQLTDPDVIDVGWTISIPTAHGPTDSSNQAGRTAPPDPAPGDEEPPPIANVPPLPAPGDEAPGEEDPNAAAPGAPDSSDGASTGERPADHTQESAPVPASGDQAGASSSDDTSDTSEGVVSVRTVGGVGALLAAGILGLIVSRRREQQRRRKPGAALPMPEGEAEEIENELRAVGDPISVELVDQALRTLAKECSAQGQPLPRVRAARLSAAADQFDLYLAEPADLPAPWQAPVDRSVWTLTAEAEEYVAAVDLTDIPAPYPALVTLGHDEEDGHVLLDLEYLGALGIGGDVDVTRQVMAALAVELATSRWADDLQVTIVGAYSELDGVLETGRVRYLPTVGRLIDQLSYRAERDRRAIAESGSEDLYQARVAGDVPGTWTPEIVLLPGQITHEQRQALAQLVEELPRVAVAAVTSGAPVGQWVLQMSDEHTGVLEPFGLQLRPQMLDDATYAQVLEVLAVTDADDETTHSEWVDHGEPTLEDVEQVLAVQLHTGEKQDDDHQQDDQQDHQQDDQQDHQQDDQQDVDDHHQDPVEVGEVGAQGSETEQADHDGVGPNLVDTVVTPMQPKAPQIMMLGPVDVTGVDDALVEPTRRKRLTELAAIISTHPSCDHTTIDACYYPGQRVSDNTRNTQMSKLRRWMGKNTEGEDYLPRYQAVSRYRFHDAVASDWEQWQQLLPDGPTGASTETLGQALALVRGRPFDGVPARRYGWAEGAKQQMVAAIVDATYELTRRQLMEGLWLAAETSSLVGLMVEPGTEALWRMRITALHARGNAQGVTRAVDQLLQLAEDWGGDLEAETEELLDKVQNSTDRGGMVAQLG